ncbi:MAG: hypothetical protein OET79_02500, partial [Nitrospirota bacterium]|nr:hypothetical protein [Nitrospirota bacterium]
MLFSRRRLIAHLGCACSINGINQFFQKVIKGLLVAGGLYLCGVSLAACTQQGRYMETHEISNLKVVFLDD